MRGYARLAAVLAGVCLLIGVVANLLLAQWAQSESSKAYRVEVNRILAAMEEGQPFSPGDWRYVTEMQTLPAEAGEEAQRSFFAERAEESFVLLHEGTFYRFLYTRSPEKELGALRRVLNVSLVLMLLVALLFGAVVHRRVLHPFQRIHTLPLELARGNLTGALPEQKSRPFGQFIAGLNLLRETLDEHKRRELTLQREKKTLLLSILHDVKTPLGLIKLYARALRDDLYGAERRTEIAVQIDEKTNDIQRALDEAIQTSSEDFLHFQVKKEEFYLSDLVDAVVGVYGERMALLRVTFAIEPYTNALLAGDFDRSVEVVQNLLENALKYGDGGSVTLLFDREEDCVLFTVRNSGERLPEAELPHVFETFWRGSNAAEKEGSGLGLSIARTLTAAMGGDIFANNSADGFDVTIVLRLAGGD